MGLALIAPRRTSNVEPTALRPVAHAYLVTWHVVGLLDHINLVQEAWKERRHGGQCVPSVSPARQVVVGSALAFDMEGNCKNPFPKARYNRGLKRAQASVPGQSRTSPPYLLWKSLIDY